MNNSKTYRPKTTLEQWRILQAVVDFGGYAQAAHALSKSQSSLNHAVSKLQSMLGVQLLEVIGRKAVLTQAGEVMLRRSRNLTANVEALELLAVNIHQDWEPEITLTVDLAFPRDALYPVLKSFLPESRGSRVKIKDTVLTGTDDAITSHEADLVIHMSVPKGHLGEPLCHIEFVLVCHPEHELAKLSENNALIDPSALEQQLQLVIADSSDTPEEKEGWLKSENRWTVSQFDTAIDLLLENIGFCWLPMHKVEQLIHTKKLKRVKVKGSEFKQLTAFLICPTPDDKGPGTTLLENLILQHRRIALPSAKDMSR
ncbi:LysR family transcriptional regulator [Ningiella sp. W23]|uniref:LysR family transcriptional regulator n=1 Tax=Ningiella sp. W23 TaxID=3023715 RepID=UPI003757B505